MDAFLTGKGAPVKNLSFGQVHPCGARRGTACIRWCGYKPILSSQLRHTWHSNIAEATFALPEYTALLLWYIGPPLQLTAIQYAVCKEHTTFSDKTIRLWCYPDPGFLKLRWNIGHKIEEQFTNKPRLAHKPRTELCTGRGTKLYASVLHSGVNDFHGYVQASSSPCYTAWVASGHFSAYGRSPGGHSLCRCLTGVSIKSGNNIRTHCGAVGPGLFDVVTTLRILHQDTVSISNIAVTAFHKHSWSGSRQCHLDKEYHVI